MSGNKVYDFVMSRVDGLLTGNQKILSDLEHVIKDVDQMKKEQSQMRETMTLLRERMAKVEAEKDDLVDRCVTASQNATTEFLTRNYAEILTRLTILEGRLPVTGHAPSQDGSQPKRLEN